MEQVGPNPSPPTLPDREVGPVPASTTLNQWPNSEDAMFSVAVGDDGQFRFEGFSPAAERLTGITNPELVGRTPEEALPLANAALVSARYRQCIREGAPIR